jgi:cytochrome c oxidase assembly protein subunit 15
METHSPHRAAGLPLVRAWLCAIAFLVFCMVVVGGATRLTGSGLSITEWQPFLGVVPPLSEGDWHAAFEKYKRIPEYRLVNAGMSLAEFKVIYWWEWTHRLLGRLIGVAFLVPFAVFTGFGWIGRDLWPRLAAIFVLGGLQGALGWYMVASGLADRTDVSQYRLAAHLALATAIFGAILWVAMGLGTQRSKLDRGAALPCLIAGLVFLQIAAGGLVAGLDAGMGYTTWPLMDGSFVPAGLLVIEPAWRNFFENAMTVQFNHRLLAYVIAGFAALHAVRARSLEAVVLALAVLLQIALGVWTLVWQVPLALGLLHQATALLVFASALWNVHAALSRSPAPDRR